MQESIGANLRTMGFQANLGGVRRRGLLLGVELVTDRDTKAPATEVAEEIFYRALDAGLSFKVTMGNVLTLTPPLTIAEGELDEALGIFGEVYRGGRVEENVG